MSIWDILEDFLKLFRTGEQRRNEACAQELFATYKRACGKVEGGMSAISDTLDIDIDELQMTILWIAQSRIDVNNKDLHSIMDMLSKKFLYDNNYDFYEQQKVMRERASEYHSANGTFILETVLFKFSKTDQIPSLLTIILNRVVNTSSKELEEFLMKSIPEISSEYDNIFEKYGFDSYAEVEPIRSGNDFNSVIKRGGLQYDLMGAALIGQFHKAVHALFKDNEEAKWEYLTLIANDLKLIGPSRLNLLFEHLAQIKDAKL
jgi:hypothetical protein